MAILAELQTRISYRVVGQQAMQPFHSVMSLLSYLLKAPVVKPGAPVVNSLSRQRAAIENVLRALVGVQPNSDMLLQHRVSDLAEKGAAVDHLEE